MVLWRYSYGLWSYGNALAGLLSSLHSLRVVWQRCSEHLLRVGLQLHHSAVTCWWLNSSCSQIHTASQCSLVLSPLTMATKEETDSPNGSAKREGDTVPYSDEKRPKHTEEKPEDWKKKCGPYIPRCMVWLLEKPEDCKRDHGLWCGQTGHFVPGAHATSQRRTSRIEKKCRVAPHIAKATRSGSRSSVSTTAGPSSPAHLKDSSISTIGVMPKCGLTGVEPPALNGYLR